LLRAPWGRLTLLDTLIARTALDHDSTRPGKGFLPHDQPLAEGVSA
jgi:hypothetical protein